MLVQPVKRRIPEVWIVDVGGEQVEVYRRPTGPRYEQVERAGRGQGIAPETFPDVAIAVDEIL